jgi:hypothetical protein
MGTQGPRLRNEVHVLCYIHNPPGYPRANKSPFSPFDTPFRHLSHYSTYPAAVRDNSSCNITTSEGGTNADNIKDNHALCSQRPGRDRRLWRAAQYTNINPPCLNFCEQHLNMIREALTTRHEE